MLAYALDAIAMILILVLLLAVVAMSTSIGALIHKAFSGAMRQAMSNARAGKTAPPPTVWTQGLAIAILLLTEFVVETCYFIFWELATGGRSIGKFIVGLRVVRRNGMPIDIRGSIVRNLMRIVDILPAEYLVGITTILLSPSGERLGDHVAGTIVIRLDRPERATEIPALESAAALVLTREQLAKLGPREIQLLRNVLRRSSTSPEPRAAALIAEVAQTMRERLGLDDQATGDNLAFLHSLLTAAERSLHDR